MFKCSFTLSQAAIFSVSADKRTMLAWLQSATLLGVNDNGSGVAAMLEAARQLRCRENVKRKNIIILLGADAGELDSTGTLVFLRRWLIPWIEKNYGLSTSPILDIKQIPPRGAIVLDTLMEYNTTDFSQTFSNSLKTEFPNAYESISGNSFRGGFLGMVYGSTRDSELAQAVADSWETENSPQSRLELFPFDFGGQPFDFGNISRYNGSGIFLKSDHIYAWVDGIRAVLLTDTADFRGDKRRCYHKSCDNLEVMLTEENLNFLGKIADAVARTVDRLSEPTDASNVCSSGASFITGVQYSWILCLIVSMTFFVVLGKAQD